MSKSVAEGCCEYDWCQRHESLDYETWHVWTRDFGDSSGVTLYARHGRVEVCPDLPEVLDAATARMAGEALLEAAQVADAWLAQDAGKP